MSLPPPHRPLDQPVRLRGRHEDLVPVLHPEGREIHREVVPVRHDEVDLLDVQGLLNYFLRAVNCGAITEEEALERSGLTLEELRGRSFVRILKSRRGEDLHDRAVVAERRDEETISLEEMKRRLRDDGLL